jgi:hypothetical protein
MGVRTLINTTKLKGHKMTKQEKEEKVKKELEVKLKWRLSEKPTSENVRMLKQDGLISTEEARQILFSEEKSLSKDEAVKALEEQVEFLKNVIDKIASKPANVVWGYINTYTPTYYWNGLHYATPITLTSGITATLTGAVNSGSTTTAYYTAGSTSAGSIGGGTTINV